MSLNVLSKDILLNAQKEKDKIFEKLKEEEKSLEEEYEKNLNSFKKDLNEKFEKDFNLESQKITSLYNKDARHEILDTKKKIIAQIKTEFLEKLLSLNSKDRQDLFEILIKRAKSILKFSQVFCDKKDTKIVKELLPKVKVSNTKILNGLIFESENGKEILDLTYESLINEIFENKEDEIQKILFSR